MPLKTPEVPRAHWEKICSRWQAGDSMVSIANDHGVGRKKIKDILVELNAMDKVKPAASPKPKAPRPGNAVDLGSFTKAARSILWRQDNSKDHPTYDRWTQRIKALESEDGRNLGRNQATVQASKDFQCLHRLFREYDVSQYDPDPDSHPGIKRWGVKADGNSPDEKMEFSGEKTSYVENIRWAAEAAGVFLQTGEHPETAPNGTAFFFYRQASDEPKDFMSKFGTMESKINIESDSDIRKESLRSIKEIHDFLGELKGDCDEESV